jgi:hypothetical protein
MSLRLERVDAKLLRLTGLNPVLANVLEYLPQILAQRDAPEAQRRLFPPPSNQRGLNEEWENYVTPELRHLFASAAETVARDLTGLERDPQNKHLSRLSFPAAHTDAWMNALNQARLILAARYDVDEAAMDRQDLDPEQPKDVAIFRIHVFGYILQLFVETAA